MISIDGRDYKSAVVDPWIAAQSRERIEAENLALRHQLNVVCRARKRVRLCRSDRLLFIWLYRLWPSVLESVVIGTKSGPGMTTGARSG